MSAHPTTIYYYWYYSDHQVSRRFFEEVEDKEAIFPRDPVTTRGYVAANKEMLDVLKLEEGPPVRLSTLYTSDCVPGRVS